MRFSFARPPAVPAAVSHLTIRGSLTLYGRILPQIQYVTDRYVITQVDRGMFIYLRDRNERLLVDRGAGRLRRIESAGQRIGADRLSAVIGTIDVRQDPEEVERRGYRCRRYRFDNANARIVISGETLVARVERVAETALHAEREHDAAHQPFALSLAPDELVIESKLRTVAADFEQNQAYVLESIEPGIAEAKDLDAIARLAIIG